MVILNAGETLSAQASAAAAITITTFGMEVTASGETFKRLSQGQASASAATIYTTPALTQTLVKTIMLTNPTGVDRTVKLWAVGVADANMLMAPVTIKAGETGIYDDAGWRFFDTVGGMKTSFGAVDAGNLTGATLAPNVLASSLTSLGTIASLVATAAVIAVATITALRGPGNIIKLGTDGVGVDAVATSQTIIAPLSAGAGTPASLIFQTGVVGASSATLQTATTVLTLSSNGSTPLATFHGTVGVGVGAGVSFRAFTIGTTITAASGSARRLSIGGTMIASANGDTLIQALVGGGVTPGAFTGLVWRSLVVGGVDVSTWTTPANVIGTDFQLITGTGATEASTINITPPTGAATNYAIRFATAATFNVLASGAITTASTITAHGGTYTLDATAVGGNTTLNVNVASGGDATLSLGQASNATWVVKTVATTGLFLVGESGVNNWLTIAKTTGAVALAGTLAVTGAFGCNAAAPRTAFASGGALNAYGAGINGYDTAGNASALYAMVVSLRAALVANGIMS